MPTTTLAGTAIFVRPKNLHTATDTAPETAATTLPRDSRCEKSRQIKSDVQTKLAIAVGTSTTAPTMAPIVHEAPHVAMRITLSTKDSRGPRSSPLNQLGKRDAVCLLGERRGNSQRLTLRGARQMGCDRCRVKSEAQGDGGDARDNRRCRYARQPKIADHKLAAARHKRAAQSKDHPGLHSRLPHDHSARRAYCNIGEHHWPDDFKEPKDHATPILVSRLQRALQRSRNVNRWQ